MAATVQTRTMSDAICPEAFASHRITRKSYGLHPRKTKFAANSERAARKFVKQNAARPYALE